MTHIRYILTGMKTVLPITTLIIGESYLIMYHPNIGIPLILITGVLVICYIVGEDTPSRTTKMP